MHAGNAWVLTNVYVMRYVKYLVKHLRPQMCVCVYFVIRVRVYVNVHAMTVRLAYVTNMCAVSAMACQNVHVMHCVKCFVTHTHPTHHPTHPRLVCVYHVSIM